MESLLGIQSASEGWGMIEETRISVEHQISVELLTRAVAHWVLLCVQSSAFDNGIAKRRIGEDEKVISEPPGF